MDGTPERQPDVDGPGLTPNTSARAVVGRLFVRASWPEASRVVGILHRETVGGALLVAAAVAALAPLRRTRLGRSLA